MLGLFQAIQLILAISGLTGLTLGQNANVFVDYPPGMGVQCQVAVDFFDANSKTIETNTFTLAPGQTKKVSLSKNQLGIFAPHPLFWFFAGVTACDGSAANCQSESGACESLTLTAYDTDAVGNVVLLLNSTSRTAAPASAD
ncbi:MAG TPA: hypothetical protein VMA09_14600 [Candidatus Binataceae bacterium]|nr:hypothetical protein [Candidatus Binataceae bacterium]